MTPIVRPLLFLLLAAGWLHATGAGQTPPDAACCGSYPQSGGAPLSADEAAGKVALLLNAGDYRELNRCYPALRDSLPPFLRDLSEALIHYARNRPAESNAAIDRLAAHPEADPGTIINMHILSFYNFRSLNDYAGAADASAKSSTSCPPPSPRAPPSRRWHAGWRLSAHGPQRPSGVRRRRSPSPPPSVP